MTAGQMDCCIACDTTEPFSMSGQASAVSSSDRNFNIGLCPKCRADLELGRKVRLKGEEENTRVAELETELNGLLKAIPETFRTRVIEGGGPEDIVKSAVLSVFRLKEGYAELAEARKVEWNEFPASKPKKPGKSRYEHVHCLVVVTKTTPKGVQWQEIKHLAWNCEHEVWDGDDGDDISPDHNFVTHWMEFPRLPEKKGGEG